MKRLDHTFLISLYPVSFVLTVLGSACALIWFGHNIATGVAIGGIFGILNTSLIASLTGCTLIPSSRNPGLAAVFFVLKVPVVWGLLILGFSQKLIDPIGFVAGFQVFILSIVIFAIYSHIKIHRSAAASDGSVRGETV